MEKHCDFAWVLLDINDRACGSQDPTFDEQNHFLESLITSYGSALSFVIGQIIWILLTMLLPQNIKQTSLLLLLSVVTNILKWTSEVH